MNIQNGFTQAWGRPLYYANVPSGGIGKFECGGLFDLGPPSTYLNARDTREYAMTVAHSRLVALVEYIIKDNPPWLDKLVRSGVAEAWWQKDSK